MPFLPPLEFADTLQEAGSLDPAGSWRSYCGSLCSMWKRKVRNAGRKRAFAALAIGSLVPLVIAELVITALVIEAKHRRDADYEWFQAIAARTLHALQAVGIEFLFSHCGLLLVVDRSPKAETGAPGKPRRTGPACMSAARKVGETCLRRGDGLLLGIERQQRGASRSVDDMSDRPGKQGKLRTFLD
jgi:hypothetical protein